MSDKGSSPQGLFDASVNPRERAAHIACAVVLTIVVVSVIVALIVYFTSGPTYVIKGDCDKDPSDASGANAQAADMQVKKVERKPTTKPTSARKPTRARAPVQRTAANKQQTRLNTDSAQAPTAFQPDSGLASAVTNNSGNTIRQAQGVTVNPRMEQFDDHLATFAQNFQGALASQNPAISQISDAPNSIHRSYQGDLNTPHLKQEYVDSTLFPQYTAEWRKQPAMPFGRSEAYSDAIVRGQGIMIPGARV
jgi:hypothetical protein